MIGSNQDFQNCFIFIWNICSGKYDISIRKVKCQKMTFFPTYLHPSDAGTTICPILENFKFDFFSQKYKNNIFHKNVAPPAEMISLTNRDPILHFFGSRCIAFDNYKLCRSLSKCLYFTPYENSMYSMYVLCVTFKAIYKTDQHISLTALCKISYNKQTGTIQYNLVILQANAVQEI